MVMFISLRFRKWKMAAGSGSGESALEELTGVLVCWIGGARDSLAGAW